MTSFTVLPRAGCAPFEVERLDVNHWVLPGILGRQVIYSDVGLRLRLTADANQNSPVKFDLGVPFTVRDLQGLEDLVPVMQMSPAMCSLIFGDINAAPRHTNGRWLIDDGAGQMRLERIDRSESKLDADVKASGRPFSLWTIVAAATSVSSGESIYLRFRFKVQRAGSTWAWQRGERRRSHAISDLRINELRDRPRFAHSPPDLESALEIKRANVFVINPARLKAGRVNPAPKYVRILEGDLWDEYVMRRLSRREEPFVATYWTLTGVNRDKPFRAFLEVERRRPTSARWAAVTVVLVVLLMTLLQSPSTLEDSVLLNAAAGAWKIAAGLFTIGVVTAVVRTVIRSASSGSYRRVGTVLDWLERRRYRRD